MSLTEQEHQDKDLHYIGRSLPLPVQTSPAPVGMGIGGVNGILETIPREDHAHIYGSLGEIALHSRPPAIYGWLPATGLAISRTTFSELFALIGTTYGVGDGSTTFNIPNLGAAPGGVYYYIKVLNV